MYRIIILFYIYDHLLQHEEASVKMFHCMRKKNGLDRVMEDCGLNLHGDIKFIEELIMKGQKNGQVKCV